MDKQGRTISLAEDTVHRKNAPKKELRQSVLSYRQASPVSGGLENRGAWAALIHKSTMEKTNNAQTIKENQAWRKPRLSGFLVTYQRRKAAVLYTRAVEYGLSGAGKISVSSECVPGVTDIPLVETSTSSDLISWSDWAAVLENAYDIIVTGEVNGEDTLNFKIPFADAKRGYIDNEKKIQIVDDVYIIRTVTDSKDASGNAVTEVYAEAEFYNLAYSVRKEEKAFDAETADAAMAYALSGTEWKVERSQSRQNAHGPPRRRTRFPSSGM